MISSSTVAMTVLDLIIVGLILAMFAVTWSLDFFKKGQIPRSGRFLVVIGVSVTGVFYLADLIIVHVMPLLLAPDKAMSLMGTLHLEVRWFVSLLSLVLISIGIVIETYHRHGTEKKMRESARQIASARNEIIQSEARFRSLLAQYPDPVYCFELKSSINITTPIEEQIAHSSDAVLVECNTLFAESIGSKAPGQILGMRFGDLTSHRDSEMYARLFHDFVENGYRLSGHDIELTLPSGEQLAFRTSMTGVIQDGELVRIWCAEKDVLEEYKTRAALEDRLEFQKFIREISMELLTTPDNRSDITIERCLERAADYAGADRASILWLDRERNVLEVLYFWNKEGRAPWYEKSLADFPYLAKKFHEGEIVRINKLHDMPETAMNDISKLTELGVRSCIFVPLVVADETLGACSFVTITDEQEWTEQDVADLRAVANLFANALLRLRSRRETERVAAELREAKSRLEAENVYLREEISSAHGFNEIIGESGALMVCLRSVSNVATTSTAVLLQGETGTGKELIARAIHDRSQRKGRPLVKVNCAALPANLVESELFGHEKGAFTGADSRKLGRFDLADGGTLFLDEIGDLPVELQSKLLRVLQSGEFERLGGHETRKVDVRIIAATNRNLREAVDRGDFRSDLYYRICTFPIAIPPLRERGRDITLLAQHLVQKHARKLGKNVTEISASMIDQLQNFEWPGNVRELEGIVQRALISSTGPVLQLAEPLRRAASAPQQGPVVVKMDLHSNEREHIRRVLEQTDWKVTGDSGAATKLGVPPSTLRSKMKKLGILRPY